jgi:capsule polysaccharide export protein KpsE/RkpR
MPSRSEKAGQAVIEQYGAEIFLDDPKERKLARQKKYERFQLIWSRRRWLGKVALYGLAVSAVIAILIPSRYESTVRLMPPDQQSTSALSSMATMAGGGVSRAIGTLSGLLGGGTSGDLVIGVLGSETVQDDLITKFNLRKVYHKKLWEDARDKLSSHTDTSVDKKSGIIEIVVKDRDPKRATAMAREYVDELNYVMSLVNTSASHRERVFLENRLQQVSQNLEQAEQSFSQFASKNTALDIPEEGKAMLTAASELEGQLIAAQTELQGLRQIYTDNNVRVRSTQARIDELQRQINKMEGGTSASTGGSSDQSGAESLELPSIRKLPLLGVTYADLLRETKVQEAVFEALTQQYELAKVNEAKELPSVKVLDPPDVPDDKSFPPRILLSVIGMLLAIGGGLWWIILSERWNKTDPHDPGKTFAKQVMADIARDIPWTSHNGQPTAAWKSRSESSKAPRAGTESLGSSDS